LKIILWHLNLVNFLNNSHTISDMSELEKPKPLRLVRDSNVVQLTSVDVSEQTLEKVLEHLQENDKLFEYNVSEEMRDPARKGLQGFLVRTYRQKNFAITGEDAVKKYIQPYDFVEFDGNSPGFAYEFYIKPGMKGIIKSVDLDRKFPLTVLWEACDELPKEKELDHEGGGLSLLPEWTFQREKISSRIELLAGAAPGRLVEPDSTRFKYSYYVPVGTKGIVTKIDQSAKFPVSVVFGNSEGYIPPDSGVLNITYSGLKLFRENNIDIKKLIRELS